MSVNIITISREFGSGGRHIGELTAKRLGYDYYDKTIIQKIAEESGLSEEFIERSGESAPSKNIFAYAFVGRDNTGFSVNDYLNSVQSKIILDIAKKGSCVIVGRCADYILKDRTDCVNIFVHGDMDKKIERISKLHNISNEEAKKLIKDTDKKRRINYNYYTDREWGRMQNYTMTLNSSELGYDKCVDIITSL